MTRFLLASLGTYPQTIVTSIKSKWTPLVFAVPVLVYLLFLAFERELTEFIIPLFPEEADKSYAFYNDFLRLCFNEMLWLSLFLLITWIFLFQVPLLSGVKAVENHLLTRERLTMLVLTAVTVFGALLIALYPLEGFPNSADEYVYLYQAETLSRGKLVREAHPLVEFFHFNHIAQKDGLSVGRFPPGWPLILSVAYVLNFPPYWVNPLFAGIALWVFFSFSKRYYGQTIALWSTLSLALTGYYLFNAASFFSHTSCLLFSVGFVYCAHLAQEKRSMLYPLLAGACLGLIMITRYYNAVLFLVPVAISLLYLHGWKSIRILILIGTGTIPFALFMMWYNHSITGNVFLPVTMWADETESLGFVKGHTFARGIEYTIRRIILFLYWASPAILALYFIYLIQKVRDHTQRYVHPEDYFFFLLLAGYLFYYHLGGNQYGPRFLFEALPFAIVFVVARVVRSRNTWSLAFVAAGMVYAIVKMPYIIQREQRVVEERTDLYKMVREAGLQNAVVLLSTHTGVIRPMPVRDLTRNHMNPDASIIYAEDRPENNEALMNYYPGRTFYRYARNREKVEGWLEILPRRLKQH